MASPDALAQALDEWSDPLDAASLDALARRAARARYVLLGEASHGTREYYELRAELTLRLVEEHGFRFVAVEGDWPSCRVVDKFLRTAPDEGPDAREMLRGAFHRWPTWMWANQEMAAFLETLRERNWDTPPGQQVGFHGLDVYSLWESLDAVMGYLREHEPELVEAAREAFRCFDPYGRDEQRYAAATAAFLPETCEREVVQLLRDLRQPRATPGERADRATRFDAEQNALVAKNAEAYYRAMMQGSAESWNVRDRHMMETLERLMAHHGPDARCVVWAHNTHQGDARATDMTEAGMVNLGQLVREAHPEETFIVGFGPHDGEVIAGSYWSAPFARMRVPEAREDSWEAIFHDAGGDRIALSDDLRRIPGADEPRGQRAIGVVYDPYRERWGNYVPTVLPARYDAFIHVDRTRALRPLHAAADPHEMPDTYPMGE